MSARRSEVGPDRPTAAISPRNVKSTDRLSRARPRVPATPVRMNSLFGCSLAVSRRWPAMLQS